MAQNYAHQFVQEKEHSYLKNFESSYSPEEVADTYRNNNQIVDIQSIDNQHQRNDEAVTSARNQVYIGEARDHVTQIADNLIHGAKKGTTDQVIVKGNHLEEQVTDTINSKMKKETAND